MKLAGSQTRSPPSHFPMPAFSRQFKSSSPDTGNLRTTSLSGKLRSLSWAAIVPSAMFGRVTYFSSLTVVCALSSISSIIMTISWLPGGAASSPQCNCPFFTHSWHLSGEREEWGLVELDRKFAELHRWASSGGEKMCSSAGIFASGVLLVLPTFLSADVGSSLPSLLVSTGEVVVLASDWLRT